MATQDPITAAAAGASARQCGPVTTAIRVMEAGHDPGRRLLLAAAAALAVSARPALGMAAHPDAELLAHRTALLTAHAEHADARAVNESMKIGTPEYEAEVRVARRLWSLISDTFAMPAPKTMEGLAVIGLALALHTEGAVCGCETDDEEFVAVSAARAILSVTGTGLPTDHMGYGDEPNFRERERIALHGRKGRIPEWAWTS